MRSCLNFMKQRVGDRPLIGVEIGVESGGNAASILESLNVVRLYLIDSWEGKFAPLFETVKDRFKGDERVVILKNSSVEGSKKIAELLDFVYIDGDHSCEAVKQDIGVWSEKVKVGGFVCGHDYTERWLGIRKAVLEYCSERGICYLVQADGRRVADGTFYCNWWFQKREHSSSLNKDSYVVEIE